MLFRSLQIARKVVEPYAEARPNHFVICELAKRLGARHRGFEMSEMEMIEETLRLSGKPSTAAFEQGRWLDCAPSFEDAHFLSGFGHADGKFHFKPDWKAVGVDHAKMPVLPDHATLIEEADAEHPFRMVAAPARSFLNTTFTETPGSQARESRPSVMIRSEERSCRERVCLYV